jgi:hypothetical protein
MTFDIYRYAVERNPGNPGNPASYHPLRWPRFAKKAGHISDRDPRISYQIYGDLCTPKIVQTTVMKTAAAFAIYARNANRY